MSKEINITRDMKYRAYVGGEMIHFSLADLLKQRAPQGLDGAMIMEFTGLTCLNGDEIFEGDILQPYAYRNSKISRGVIIEHEGMYCFTLDKELHKKYRPLRDALSMGMSAGNRYMIIGNIHQHPELVAPKA